MDQYNWTSFSELENFLLLRFQYKRRWIHAKMYTLQFCFWLAVFLGDHGKRLNSARLRHSEHAMLILLTIWQYALRFHVNRMGRVQVKVERDLKRLKLLTWHF